MMVAASVKSNVHDSMPPYRTKDEPWERKTCKSCGKFPCNYRCKPKSKACDRYVSKQR